MLQITSVTWISLITWSVLRGRANSITPTSAREHAIVFSLPLINFYIQSTFNLPVCALANENFIAQYWISTRRFISGKHGFWLNFTWRPEKWMTSAFVLNDVGPDNSVFDEQTTIFCIWWTTAKGCSEVSSILRRRMQPWSWLKLRNTWIQVPICEYKMISYPFQWRVSILWSFLCVTLFMCKSVTDHLLKAQIQCTCPVTKLQFF